MTNELTPETISHPEMVARLAKNGAEIKEDLTAGSTHILHMAVGISGEVGELLLALHLNDHPNIVEELGDIFFYLEGLSFLGFDKIDLDKQDSLFQNVMNMPPRIALAVASADLLDYAKKISVYALYRKPELMLALAQRCLLVDFIIEQIMVEQGGISKEECLLANKKKLFKRYAGFNYSNDAADKRADKTT